ncbi:unnamed protein product [Clonostachys rosea]|uniref:Uncharacterized protein n=1 Tax=Bionectria ochroleuca TaxID=29856 RepID=A0ABY6V2E9_BIOOC|nr:unnamed protein product [Clonostachys rosea]
MANISDCDIMFNGIDLSKIGHGFGMKSLEFATFFNHNPDWLPQPGFRGGNREFALITEDFGMVLDSNIALAHSSSTIWTHCDAP